MLNETPTEVVVEVVQYIKWKDELTMLFRGGNNEIMRYHQSYGFAYVYVYICSCLLYVIWWLVVIHRWLVVIGYLVICVCVLYVGLVKTINPQLILHKTTRWLNHFFIRSFFLLLQGLSRKWTVVTIHTYHPFHTYTVSLSSSSSSSSSRWLADYRSIYYRALWYLC